MCMWVMGPGRGTVRARPEVAGVQVGTLASGPDLPELFGEGGTQLGHAGVSRFGGPGEVQEERGHDDLLNLERGRRVGLLQVLDQSPPVEVGVVSVSAVVGVY